MLVSLKSLVKEGLSIREQVVFNCGGFGSAVNSPALGLIRSAISILAIRPLWTALILP